MHTNAIEKRGCQLNNPGLSHVPSETHEVRSSVMLIYSHSQIYGSTIFVIHPKTELNGYTLLFLPTTVPCPVDSYLRVQKT